MDKYKELRFNGTALERKRVLKKMLALGEVPENVLKPVRKLESEANQHRRKPFPIAGEYRSTRKENENNLTSNVVN